MVCSIKSTTRLSINFEIKVKKGSKKVIITKIIILSFIIICNFSKNGN